MVGGAPSTKKFGVNVNLLVTTATTATSTTAEWIYQL
jgi:hypothetical protein